MPQLFAISDLHVERPPNRKALEELPSHREDWLIVAGDVCTKLSLFAETLDLLKERFAEVLWTPGNHDLWTPPGGELKGVDRYRLLVEMCRARRVHTPEDPFPVWPGDPDLLIAPVFTLYDYTFRPPEVRHEEAVAWAAETGVLARDESLLHPDPFPSREAWCHHRVELTQTRLDEHPDKRFILAGHFPLLPQLARLRRIPRFSIWCGTVRTADWHRRYRVEQVVYGHLHIPRREVIDGVVFQEVSLGYPEQWDVGAGFASRLRPLL